MWENPENRKLSNYRDMFTVQTQKLTIRCIAKKIKPANVMPFSSDKLHKKINQL